MNTNEFLATEIMGWKKQIDCCFDPYEMVDCSERWYSDGKDVGPVEGWKPDTNLNQMRECEDAMRRHGDIFATYTEELYSVVLPPELKLHWPEGQEWHLLSFMAGVSATADQRAIAAVKAIGVSKSLGHKLKRYGYHKEDVAKFVAAYERGGIDDACKEFEWANDDEHDYSGELRNVIQEWERGRAEMKV